LDNIPISFEHEGKKYTGTLDEVSGAGAAKTWHLMVDKYYWGQLVFTDNGFSFLPQNDEWLKDFSEYMGEVVTLWYE
jgi:hypothetical protein